MSDALAWALSIAIVAIICSTALMLSVLSISITRDEVEAWRKRRSQKGE